MQKPPEVERGWLGWALEESESGDEARRSGGNHGAQEPWQDEPWMQRNCTLSKTPYPMTIKHGTACLSCEQCA